MHEQYRLRTAMIPAAVALALSGSAFGATQSSQPKSADHAQMTKSQNLREVRASNLIGQNVKSPQGKSLGGITDLIVDMNTGNVRYAILSFDPGIFSGERLFAVPTKELKLGPGKNEVVYNMTRERLESAGVEKRDWPGALRNRDYLAGLDRTYGGVVQPSQDRRAFSASELLGKDVNGRQGEEIGEIRDLVIDMNGQRVHYAVLAFDPSWAAPERLFAFPVSAFTFTQGKDELALDLDKSGLKGMRSFDHSLWTAYSTPAFVTDIDRYLITITPLADRTSSSGKSAATGASSTSAASSQGGSVVTTSPEYTASMKRLQDAAQKLREAIQAMAQQPAGDRRNQAIKEAHQALNETNQAMVQLPSMRAQK
jgi:sporulation protein YlmC with PRC-barrel domain